jgi:hypothetical protein
MLPAMHARTSASSAALAAAALLALPGVAGAATSKTVVAGPITVKAYKMTLVATDSGASDGLMVMFNRAAGTASQTHMYSFAKGLKVAVKGATATIKGSLGRYGSVNLKLNATKKTRGIVPPGCTGKPGTTRSGVAAGKLKLVADSTYFRTITAKRLNASIPAGGSLKCDSTGGNGGNGGQFSGTMLSSSTQDAAGMLMLSILKDAGGVRQSVMRMDDEAAIAPASSIVHMISAPAGAPGLTVADDLSSASAAAAGPFLAGSLQFAGEGFGSVASGTLSGDFAAKFDSIGTQQLAAGGPDATLMKR